MARDSRLKLTLIDSPIHTLINTIDLSTFDLIFIDDSVTIPERVETIEAVSGSFLGRSVVVIHDYERAVNRRAAQELHNHFTFTALNPYTGIGQNQAKISKGRLKSLGTLLKQYAGKIQLEDVNDWIKVIDLTGSWP